jgi:hypothetical protein
MRAAMIAGVCSGVSGLVLFLILHAAWIMPIWFITPIGSIIAIAGGIAIGWAYFELLPSMPAGAILRTIVVTSLIVAVLTPAFVLAELRDPLFNVTEESAVLAKPLSFAVLIFLAELLVTATLVGGLIGWLIRRTRRAAAAVAVAAFAFALGPGHNIPLIGGTPGIGMEVRIMIPVMVLVAAVLVSAHGFLAGRPSAQPRGLS